MLLKDYEKGQSLKGREKFLKVQFRNLLPPAESIYDLIEDCMLSDAGGSIFCGVNEKTSKVEGLLTNAMQLQMLGDRVEALFPSKQFRSFYHFVGVPVRQAFEGDFQMQENQSHRQVIEIHVQSICEF